MSPSAAVLSTVSPAASSASFATLVGKVESRRQASTRESALLATVAHELRNPLTSLRLSLDMLVSEIDELPPESALLLIQRAQRSVAHLHGLIENLTSTTAVDAGHLQVNATTMDLEPAVDEAIGLVQGLLAQRNQSVEVYFAGDGSPVRGDRARVVQVIANLLGNASKYSVERDTIEVHVMASAHHTRVRVSDHGPGISPQEQQRIFGAWQRGQSAAPGGLGLGLSIVQNLVQQLGGRVGVESTLGQGATFWFTLPNAA
ncbi:MAG: HAMP domain-containing histidine kinase [Chloroflexi bacterium]|nr:HAMP domain-containing histidine kinase [Chloroflexota bacterium]